MFEDVRASTWNTDAVLLVALFVVLVVTLVPAGQAFLIQRASRTVGLPVGGRTQEMVRTAQVQKWRGFAIGALVGLAVSTFFVWFIGADRGSPAIVELLGGTVIGGAVGSAIASAFAEASRSVLGVRVAHAERRRLADYAPAAERWAARSSVVLAVIVLSTVAWLSTFAHLRLSIFPESFSAAAVYTTAAVVALAAFEFGGRSIVQRTQASGSALELAWADALRSSVVRDLLAAAFLLGVFGVVGGLGEIGFALGVEAGGNSISHPVLWRVAAGTLLVTAFAATVFLRCHPRRSPGMRTS